MRTNDQSHFTRMSKEKSNKYESKKHDGDQTSKVIYTKKNKINIK